MSYEKNLAPKQSKEKKKTWFQIQNVNKKKAKGSQKQKKKGQKKNFNLMKSKISSLSKSEDFKNLLNGRKILNPYSTIFFKKLSSKSNKSLNVSFVTKRKIGNAVKRNKIKRRLRNIMNDAINRINMNLNYSYLFIAKKNIYDVEYKIIKDSIFKDLTKVR